LPPGCPDFERYAGYYNVGVVHFGLQATAQNSLASAFVIITAVLSAFIVLNFCSTSAFEYYEHYESQSIKKTLASPGFSSSQAGDRKLSAVRGWEGYPSLPSWGGGLTHERFLNIISRK
jgi:hypothetical protein